MEGKGTGMWVLIKLIVVLLILGFLALTGYAYLVDLAPPATETQIPVVLHGE